MGYEIEELYKFFYIKGDARHRNNRWSEAAVIITPEYISGKVVQKEWNYVCSKSPAAYQHIDYLNAINLLQERNPTWQVIYPSRVAEISFSPRNTEVYPKPLPKVWGRNRYVRVTGMQAPNRAVVAEYEVDSLLTKDEADSLVRRYLERDKLLPLEEMQIFFVPDFLD